jgi:gamma-glutamyltranspeptidase/glutathione hydrolase
MLVDGDLPKLGSRYRQPILAETLEALGEIGWTYFYGGRWGRNLVEALQQIDGRMAIEDLEHYEVRWDEPLRGNYLGYDIVANAPPQIGGSILIAGLNVAEALDIHNRPSRDTSAETLHDEMRSMLAGAGSTGFFGAKEVRVDLLSASVEQKSQFQTVLSKEWAKKRAAETIQVRAGGRPPNHSHTFVCIDGQGSCAALTHTCHGNSYGDCGVVVGGVHLNGSATTIPGYGYWPGPGGRACDALTADLVLRDGRPVMAATAIGVGLHAAQLANHINVLARGMSVADSVQAKRFGSCGFMTIDGQGNTGVMVENFDNAILDKVESMGQKLERRSRGDGPSFADAGVWAGVSIDHKTGMRMAATDPRLQGSAMGG